MRHAASLSLLRRKLYRKEINTCIWLSIVWDWRLAVENNQRGKQHFTVKSCCVLSVLTRGSGGGNLVVLYYLSDTIVWDWKTSCRKQSERETTFYSETLLCPKYPYKRRGWREGGQYSGTCIWIINSLKLNRHCRKQSPTATTFYSGNLLVVSLQRVNLVVFYNLSESIVWDWRLAVENN